MRLTILLPAYNAAATVQAAIASLRAQTFDEWELLIIDDGSTDATSERACAAAADDGRIRILRRPHEGLVAALNAGLAQARGEFVARMDADDIAHPHRLAEQVRYLDANPDIGLVSCLVEFGGDPLANAGYALHVDWINSLSGPDEIALNRFIESPLAHPSVMFRRALIDEHGGYRSGDFPEDYELWLRWLGAGVRMAKVPRPLLRWNDPPARLSRMDLRYSPEKFFEIKAPWIVRELTRRGAVVPPSVTSARQDAVPPSELTARPPGVPQSVVRDITATRGVWIWGAGRPTRKRAAHLTTYGVAISGYIDIDPRKTGRAIATIPVISPDRLPPPSDAYVLAYVSSRGARSLIRSQLRSRGYLEGPDFLVCA